MMTARRSSLKALVQSSESTAKEELCSRMSWSARGTTSMPDEMPIPCWPDSRRRVLHRFAAAVATGLVAARRKAEGTPMGRRPWAREGGEVVGVGLEEGEEAGYG